MISLMKAGKSATQIRFLLEPLKIAERFVYCTIACYKETGDVSDHAQSRWNRSIHTKPLVEAVHSRIDRNAVQTLKS